MKNAILYIIVSFLVLSLHAQKPLAKAKPLEDYYLNFWQQNLDTLCRYAKISRRNSKPLPTAKGVVIPTKNYQEFMGQLNIDMPLHYDARVGEILSYYISDGEKTAFALGYSNSLENKFTKELKKQNLPLCLKYLPLALTAMNDKAIGATGAAGLWQLRYSTARREGLDIDSYVDERRNIDKSTVAALKEIKQLYRLYQDWNLALGAYACGPSNVNKTIRRMDNQRDYYDLYPDLPAFGRDIVPALLAAAILSQNHKDFGIKIPSVDFNIAVDTLEVSQRLHFVQLNKVLHINIDTLRFLNPQYKHDIVPAVNQVYTILLPKGKLNEFNALEDSIYHFQDSLLFELKRPMILPPPSKTRRFARYEPERIPDGSALVYYHIKSGDNLGFVATWYDVKSSQIEDWNNVYDPRRLQIGKRLKIYVPEEKEAYYKKVDKMSFAAKQKREGKTVSNNSASHKVKKLTPLGKNWFYHTVRQGESPYLIAKKYPGVSADDILRWNKITNPRNIRAGQKLKIKKQ